MAVVTVVAFMLLCLCSLGVAQQEQQHHGGNVISSAKIQRRLKKRRTIQQQQQQQQQQQVSSSPPFESLHSTSRNNDNDNTLSRQRQIERSNQNHRNAFVIPTFTSRSSLVTTSSLGSFSFTLLSSSSSSNSSSFLENQEFREEVTLGTEEYLENVLKNSDFASDGKGAFSSIELTLESIQEVDVDLESNATVEEGRFINRQLRQRHHIPAPPRNIDSTTTISETNTIDPTKTAIQPKSDGNNPVEVILTFSAEATFSQPLDPTVTNGDEILSYVSQVIQEEENLPPLGEGIGGGNGTNVNGGGYVQMMKERSNENGDDAAVSFWDNVSAVSVAKTEDDNDDEEDSDPSEGDTLTETDESDDEIAVNASSSSSVDDDNATTTPPVVPTPSPTSFVLSNQPTTNNDDNETNINNNTTSGTNDTSTNNNTNNNGGLNEPEPSPEEDENKYQRKQTAAIALGISAGVVALILLITSYFYRRWELRDDFSDIEYTSEGEALTLDHPPAPSPASSSSRLELLQREFSAASSSIGAASNPDTMIAAGVKESTFARHEETDAEGRRLKSRRRYDGEEGEEGSTDTPSGTSHPPPEWLSSQTQWWDSTKKIQQDENNRKGLSKSLPYPLKSSNRRNQLTTQQNQAQSFTAGTAASRRRLRQEEDNFLHNSTTPTTTAADYNTIGLLLQDSERINNMKKTSSASTTSSGKKASPFSSWRGSLSKSSSSMQTSSSSSFGGKKALLKQNRDKEGEGRNSLTQRLRSFLGGKSSDKNKPSMPIGESSSAINEEDYMSNKSIKEVERLTPIKEGLRESIGSADATGILTSLHKEADSLTQNVDDRSNAESEEEWHRTLTPLPYKFDPKDESASSSGSNSISYGGSETNSLQQSENDGIWRIKSTEDHSENKKSDASLSHHDILGDRKSRSAKSSSGAGSLSQSDHTCRSSLPRVVGEEPAAAAAALAASHALSAVLPGHASVGSSTRRSRRSPASISNSSKSTRLNELQASLDDLYCDLSAKTKQTDTQKEVLLAADRKAQREEEEKLLYEDPKSVLRRTSVLEGGDENAEMVTILDDPNEEEMEDEAMKMMMRARSRVMEDRDDDENGDRNNNLSHSIL